MKQTRTFEEKSSTNEVQDQDQQKKRTPKWVQIRRFPIIIRLALVIALVAASLIIGLMVGYGVIGDGNPQDALKKETWTHILDLVVKDTK